MVVLIPCGLVRLTVTVRGKYKKRIISRDLTLLRDNTYDFPTPESPINTTYAPKDQHNVQKDDPAVQQSGSD